MTAFVNMMDLVYPIGSIYQSMSPTNPGAIFLGQWTQIKEGFLRSALDSGVTGGNANITLEAKNLPPHRHTIYGGWQNSSGKNIGTDVFLYSQWNIVSTSWRMECSGSSNETSMSSPFSILPPYTTCYTWFRNS